MMGVEIVSGLRAGERIVVSGNFLIDSESQMKAAAAATPAVVPEPKGPGPNQPATAPAGGAHKH